jgi:hypothetical protein
MEEEDEFSPNDEQAIRDRIDDEIVNRDLMERADTAPAQNVVSLPLYNSQSAPPRTSTHRSGVSIARRRT